MRILRVGPRQSEQIASVCAFANSAENVIDAANPREYGPDTPPPFYDPRHIAILGDYYCVFTITKGGGSSYRHLSISLGSPDRVALPVVACQIATLFGFTGWTPEAGAPDRWGAPMPADWEGGKHQADPFVWLMQPLDGRPPRN
jgi:hypothetical protein